MRNKLLSILSIFILLAIIFHMGAQSADKVDKLFSKMKWRNIGPANMGGRTIDIEVVEKTPWVIYAATGSGGVWRSKNNGITWNPVFHKESSVAVGDMAIDQNNPKLLWVGTGEATARNSVTIGDGVYKSTNGGRKWSHMGLKETRHISRILIHPKNPEIVYVAAQGHLWGPNKERGVYKTNDGGKTWKKVLYINESTGIADLAINPANPNILYAAAWEYMRSADYFYSGGKGSGIYRSLDGGKNWSLLKKDLPGGICGRIGIAVSRSNPDMVYALIENKNGGIFRSKDNGENWERRCDYKTFKKVNSRPFYYSHIHIDPQNSDKIYVLSTGGYVSKDGGKKFRSYTAGTHSDHHALWIDPKNPKHLIDGNDGGIDITYDGGKNWHPIRHMVLAQVYQIGLDMRKPYHVYCGLQDNGVWEGPSATYDTRGISNAHWTVLNVMGDGFFVQPDPTDHNRVYANYQMNGLTLVNQSIGRGKGIRPEASLKAPPYRWNWSAPIFISPHDVKTIYTGGNFLFHSSDYGHSWKRVSPDLTSNDKKKQKDSGGPITLDNSGAEIHCTITTISESPLKQGVIWCGTDDGNIQLTRNGGKSWVNLIKNIPNLPTNTWCSRIEASRFKAGTAYAAFDGHRSDDYSTYLYKTTDYGISWQSISNNLPFGWVHVIREDLKNPNLLFAGMEFGIFASLDQGKSWLSLRNNLPTVAVHDLAIHPREHDLVIGTHGRGIWIMDDITPLQAFSEQLRKKKVHLFQIRTADQYFSTSRFEGFGKMAFSAKNPAYGVNIISYFGKKPKKRPHLKIKDQAGQVIYEKKFPTKTGLIQTNWSLVRKIFTPSGKVIKLSDMAMASPPEVEPGTFTAELHVDGDILKKDFTVLADPRVTFSETNRARQREAQAKMLILGKKMGLSVTAVRFIRRKINKLKKAKSYQSSGKLQRALKHFEKKFKVLEEILTPKGIGYMGSAEAALRGGPIGGSIPTYVMFLGMSIGNYPDMPTLAQEKFLKELNEKGDGLVIRLNRLLTGELNKLNKKLEKLKMKPIKPPKPVEL